MKERELVLTNCHAVDATLEAPLKDAAIWVKREHIEEVGNAEQVVNRAKKAGVTETLDLRGAYVTPGLINMHVHLCLALPGAEATRLASENDAELALRIASNARKALHAGATSLRLVSEKRHADFALRKAIARGEAQGPRLFTAGSAISCTGGHGRGAGSVEADGPAEFRKVARAQLKAGADLIKVMISGGISGEFEGRMDSQVAPDELRAVTEVAHGWDKKVTAHAGPAHVIKMGIECGLDCIEHGYELNEEVVQLMVERGTWARADDSGDALQGILRTDQGASVDGGASARERTGTYGWAQARHRVRRGRRSRDGHASRRTVRGHDRHGAGARVFGGSGHDAAAGVASGDAEASGVVGCRGPARHDRAGEVRGSRRCRRESAGGHFGLPEAAFRHEGGGGCAERRPGILTRERQKRP